MTILVERLQEKIMEMRRTLTQKQITKLNNDYINFKSNNPDSKRTFSDFKKEFFKERHKKDIEKAKEANKKVRSLERSRKKLGISKILKK